MSRKPLVIVANDPEFIQLKSDLDNNYEMLNESIEFMKKQLEEVEKKTIRKAWTEIENKLKERGLVPEEYSQDKNTSEFLEFKDGVLYLSSKDSDPMSILGSLFGKR